MIMVGKCVRFRMRSIRSVKDSVSGSRQCSIHQMKGYSRAVGVRTPMSALNLAAQLLVCTEDGGFEPLVCDKLACWNVDELTGERDFCSHANDVEVTELEIEGAPQGPVGRTVQKRRSVNKDFDIFGDKETFKGDGLIENAHITVNHVDDILLSLTLPQEYATASSSKRTQGRVLTCSTTQQANTMQGPSPATANVSFRALRRTRPIQYARRNAHLSTSPTKNRSN
ncbi:uncharacterized protein LOC111243568 [Varroa destructor]|uniref:Uncharacterized protein n=1 Tax=Varroa destructor TaxID=109461 RepID=A0A7M7M952_VARDE|nr:uncharacterized protein LOC111243568 [Varroa destructor]